MTVENFKYRTDPLFLRNQFSETGQYGIPMIPKLLMSKTDLQEIRFISFDHTKTNKGENADRIVHFSCTITNLKNFGKNRING